MATTRYSPNQIHTDVPLESAREVAWRILVGRGFQRTTIDPPKNIVGGYVEASLISSGQVCRIHFQPDAQGTLITVNFKAALGRGGIRARKQQQQIADQLQAALNQGGIPAPVGPPVYDPSASGAVEASPTVAPIAAPTGEVVSPQTAPNYWQPYYGPIMPVPMGSVLVQYAVFSLLCCQIAAPFTIAYSIGALKEYGSENPGDRGMVITALVLGCLGTLLFVVRIGVLAVSLANK